VNAAAGDELVLAVDGGGVKTDLALLDSSGRLLSVVRGAGSSTHYVGIDGCVAVLETLFERAVVQAGLGARKRPVTETGQVLLAGADLPEELSEVRSRLEQLMWSERLVLDNDTVALLRAGTDRGWGIAVVCGAGINCLGRAPDGREIRFPSLGPISGDWGGGRDVGLAALFAAARSADGRGPPTALETAVPAHFGFGDPDALARAVHLGQIAEPRLGELAPVVLGACDEDPVAAEIVRRLAGEVVAFTRAVVRRLDLVGSDPDVVLGGSLLRAIPPGTAQTIAVEVRAVAPRARVVIAPSEPIVGAALLGLDALGAGPGVRARARAELDAAVGALRRGGGDRGESGRGEGGRADAERGGSGRDGGAGDAGRDGGASDAGRDGGAGDSVRPAAR
jgi:N-acetylglucosamine kinase-like BadF-type ATPase